MKLLRWGLGCFAAIALASSASAQTYPTKPIRIVVPFAAGAAVDILARLAGDWISAQSGQTVVVENRTGAGGLLALEQVARSAPDGHTLLVTADGPMTVGYLMAKERRVDPTKDFAPVARIADVITIIAVNSKVPATTLKEFVDYAKANPGKINYASAGIGTTQHIAMAYFARLAGLNLVHVPYRGVAATTTDLVAGNVQAIATGYGIMRPHVATGALRLLAAGSKERPAYAPDLPTGVELGYPDWQFATWVGMFAPSGTPAPVVEQLNSYMRSFAGDETIRKRLADSYYTGSRMSLAEVREFVSSQTERGRRMVKELDITPE